jgi:hypothetical protein
MALQHLAAGSTDPGAIGLQALQYPESVRQGVLAEPLDIGSAGGPLLRSCGNGKGGNGSGNGSCANAGVEPATSTASSRMALANI